MSKFKIGDRVVVVFADGGPDSDIHKRATVDDISQGGYFYLKFDTKGYNPWHEGELVLESVYESKLYKVLNGEDT